MFKLTFFLFSSFLLSPRLFASENIGMASNSKMTCRFADNTVYCLGEENYGDRTQEKVIKFPVPIEEISIQEDNNVCAIYKGRETVACKNLNFDGSVKELFYQSFITDFTINPAVQQNLAGTKFSKLKASGKITCVLAVRNEENREVWCKGIDFGHPVESHGLFNEAMPLFNNYLRLDYSDYHDLPDHHYWFTKENIIKDAYDYAFDENNFCVIRGEGGKVQCLANPGITRANFFEFQTLDKPAAEPAPALKSIVFKKISDLDKLKVSSYQKRVCGITTIGGKLYCFSENSLPDSIRNLEGILDIASTNEYFCAHQTTGNNTICWEHKDRNKSFEFENPNLNSLVGSGDQLGVMDTFGEVAVYSLKPGKENVFDGTIKGNLKYLKFLINFLKADINLQENSSDLTLLHIASIKGSKDIVEFLISKGANINATGMFNLTPLHFASRSGHKDVVETLIASPEINIDARDSYGMTPLHRASLNGNLEVVKSLVKVGHADFLAKTNKEETALEIAIAYGHTDIADYLRGL